MLNIITLQGRLTKDVELRTTQNDTPVASFTIASDGNGTNDTVFVNCVAWRKTAEFVNKYFHKGSMIVLSGRLQSRNYETKEGEKRTAWEVVAEQVHFCGMKSDGGTRQAADKPVMVEVDDGGDLPF